MRAANAFEDRTFTIWPAKKNDVAARSDDNCMFEIYEF